MVKSDNVINEVLDSSVWQYPFRSSFHYVRTCVPSSYLFVHLHRRFTIAFDSFPCRKKCLLEVNMTRSFIRERRRRILLSCARRRKKTF